MHNHQNAYPSQEFSEYTLLQVTLKKQWRLVYEGLGSHHSPRVTNAATCTRKAYEK